MQLENDDNIAKGKKTHGHKTIVTYIYTILKPFNRFIKQNQIVSR